MMLNKKLLVSTAFSLLAMSLNTSVQAQEKESTESVRMPIEAFAIEPAMKTVNLSPNGKKIGYLRAMSKRGDYILEVRPTSNLGAEPVVFGADRMEMTNFFWLNDEQIMVSFRQNIQDGNRNYWVTKRAIVNSDGTGKWEVPFAKENFTNYGIVRVDRSDPEHIYLSYDINGDRFPDVIRYNINSGRTNTILRGNEKVSGGFIADYDNEVRAGEGYDASTSSIVLYARAKGSTEWQEIHKNSPESREIFDFLYFNKENPNEIYVRATLGNNTAGIYTYNIETKTFSERLFGLESVDASDVIISTKLANTGELLGFSYTAKHPKRYFINPDEDALYKSVQAIFPKKFVSLPSRSEDDSMIIVRTSGDKDPGTYYLLKGKQELVFIGDTAPLIDSEKLAKVRYVKYKARDGLVIPAYVTIPHGKGPFPTVVMPHGGPWARDVNIYDEWSQLIANAGYLVIQPQFRGSEGFGLELWKAGDEQWGLKMQDDLDDAAMYLVKKGLADEDRLAMFGWSYGGYAAFVASMRDNNIYKCSVAGAGVGDLDRVLSSINGSRYLRTFQAPTIKGVDPIDNVKNVNIPIYVVHGDIDQRVPIKHSRTFIDALKSHTTNFKYTELEGADHFSNTLYYEHKMQFYGELIDWFDNKCFNGGVIAAN
ncbi:MAG: prolyl oligopeptidase family serine peptidase [Glaciecola sp.]